MVIACKGINILKRVLCLFLCVLLLFCFFMIPRAQAVALEATTVAYGGLLIGTILVGAGVVFSSHGDMVKVGNAMYKTFVDGSSAIGNTISSIAAWAVEHGEAVAKGALRVGKDLYEGIIDAYKAVSGADLAKSYTITKDNCEQIFDFLNNLQLKKFTITYDSGRVADIEFVWTDDKVVSCYIDGKLEGGSTWRNFVGLTRAFFRDAGSYCAIDYRVLYTDGKEWGGSFNWSSLHPDYPFTVGYTAALPSADDLVYPSDDYLVKMPDIPSVDTATGDITYPNDTAYTKDAVAVPYPVDADGTKVPDIPYDRVVDQSTGQTLDDTDTGTDTGTDTDNPSKPGEDTDTDTPSDSVDWPDSGSLSLPELIASKFPFCIPFDVARLVGLLEAEPKAPVFRIPVVYADVVNEEIVIDFDKFADVLQIIRWGEIMLFVAGLVVITRNYIKW